MIIGMKNFVNEALQHFLSEIERKDMPQVRGKDLPEMLEIFDKHDIPYKTGVVKCGSLKPVQEDYIPEKKQGIMDSLSNGKKLGRIVISQDGFIMDGHHRWLAVKELWGDSYKMPVIQILLPKVESLKLFDVVSDKVSEEIITELKKKLVVVYAGRFQPFHLGHYYSYQELVKQFGKDNVYITTSDKVDLKKSPFTFKEKEKIISKMFGIPADHIIKSRQPYKPAELFGKLSGSFSVIYAIGEKDIARFSNAKRYSRSQKYTGDKLEKWPEYYYMQVPQLQMKIGNQTISGTAVREIFKHGTDKAKKELFKKLYGKFDQEIYDLLNAKISAMKEIVELLNVAYKLVKKVSLNEISDAVAGEVDDGPATFYRSLEHYRRESTEPAEQLGYKVISYMVSQEDIDDAIDLPFVDAVNYRYNIVPVVSYGSSGVAGKKDLRPVRKYRQRISRIARQAGYEIIKFMGMSAVGEVEGVSVETPEIYLRKKSLEKSREKLEDTLEEVPIEERIKIDSDLKILIEGGAYGHMSHPFDDWQLTFSDLKQMIETALQGNLELAKEKTDGQNLFVSWKDGKLVAARNKSQLKNFGKEALDKNQISQMFSGRGEIQDAFVFTMEDLETAISKLSQKQRDKIFADGHKFMNLEIIYPATTNVIPYGISMLVFHNSVEVDQDGNQSAPSREDAKILSGMIKQVNQNMQKNFQIKYPAEPKISLSAVKDLSSKKSYYNTQLDNLRKHFNLGDTDTIALYHQKWWEDFITKQAKKLKYSIPNSVLMNLVKRWAFGEKSFSINNMKKEIKNEKFLEWAIDFDKNNHDEQMKKNMEPFELLFLKLGAEILQNTSNFLAANPEESMQKLKKEVDKAVKDIQSTKDVRKIGILKQQLAKLQALGGNNVIVPTEGIVFNYKGNVYKLTGAFAPVNQILGLLKFAR